MTDTKVPGSQDFGSLDSKENRKQTDCLLFMNEIGSDLGNVFLEA